MRALSGVVDRVGDRSNVFLFDLTDENPLNFGLYATVQNVDLQAVITTLRDYPDRRYVEEKVVPNYLAVKQRTDVSLDRVTSVIQDYVATYDRAIIPIRFKNGSILSLSMTETRLLVGHVDLEEKLTERQKLVLSLLAEGCSAKQIAIEIGLSNRTVEHHLEAIKKNMGARNVAHAVSMYVAALSVKT